MYDLTPEEVETERTLYGPFAQAIRELVDAGIRTTVPDEEIRRAQADIEAVTARLRSSQLEGPLRGPVPDRRPGSGLGERRGGVAQRGRRCH